MIWKRFITFVVCLAFLLIPFEEANAEPDPPQPIIAQCLIAALVIGVGVVILIGLYKMCRCLPPSNCSTNKVDHANNTIQLPPLLSPAEGGPSTLISVESAVEPGGPWSEALSFQFREGASGLEAVALKHGVPVMTNSVPVLSSTNGMPLVTYDFTTLSSAVTNHGNFFRSVNR